MPTTVLKLLTIALMLAAGNMSVHAKTLEFKGKMGVLGEWEFSGHAMQDAQGEFFGPINMNHVGLCTHDGPVQKQAQIRFTAVSRNVATIFMDGAECAFSATKSSSPDGVLACPNSTPIPLTLDILQ